MFKLWILIIVFSIVVTYPRYERERREARILQSQIGVHTLEVHNNTYNFLKDMMRMICILGSVLMCIWGLLSIYLGNQINRDLERIRVFGDKTTGSVAACNIESYYSVLGTEKYSYLIDFEVNGETKRSSTVSSLYTNIGETVDIYYLPHTDNYRGGIALTDVDEKPGNERMFFGYIGVCIAIVLFVCGRRLKDNGNVEKESRIKINGHYIRLIFAIGISFLAVIQLMLGGLQNAKDKHIQKEGERTYAIIRQCQNTHNIIYKGDKVLYKYTVEFCLNDETKTGIAKSVKLLHRDDTVMIAYVMDERQDSADVVFANFSNLVGYNNIYHGILALLLSIVVWIDVKKRGKNEV